MPPCRMKGGEIVDKVDLYTFPSNRAEALALEYAKAKMTDTTTPEDFAEMYRTALERIKEYFREVRHGSMS